MPVCHIVVHRNDTACRRLAVSIVESAKWTYLASSFFGMWVLILTLQLALDAQYRLLKARLARAAGRAALLRCGRHLQSVFQLEADIKAYFFNVSRGHCRRPRVCSSLTGGTTAQALLHMLAGALLVPLINTYQLLFGPRTMFSGLTLSTLPLVYGSMSLLGDRLDVGCQEVKRRSCTQ